MRHPPSNRRTPRSRPVTGFTPPPPAPRHPADPRPDPVLEPERFRAWATRQIAREQARRRPRGPRQPTLCTVSSGYYPTGRCTVPVLRLRGKWLKAMGFDTGTRVQVEVRDGALILHPCPPPGTAG